MKRKKIIPVITLFIILLFIYTFFITKNLNILYLKNYNKFDYNSAEERAIKYFKKNETQLENIVKELYKSKSSIKDPYRGVSYASYNHLTDFDFNNEVEYIVIDLDSQGMLGGQYYGLIYSKNNKLDLIIFDEYKETGKGNNIFIRKKIKDNWYFYYDDFDGKVDVDKIKKG